MSYTTRVLIADDHSIVSRGLSYLISFNYSSTEIYYTDTIKGIYSILTKENISHLILDLNLLDGNSLENIPDIREKFPHIPILIHSMASEELYAKRLFKYNIAGFLSKASKENEIVKALGYFFTGEKYMSTSLMKTVFGSTSSSNNNTLNSLSDKELKVLELILKGLGTKEIGNNLDIAPQTVTTYKNRIYIKLGTNNIFEIEKIWQSFNY